ncbi:hypothetical protein L6V77_23745 [Myxococcota bacterium]|nr:hypothetical protein [Myxococcota bacterium]
MHTAADRCSASVCSPRAFAVALALVCAPAARAEVFDAWIAGTATSLGATGSTFTAFDGPLYGAAGGFEIFGVDLFGEAMAMGREDYLFALNIGFDLTWDVWQGKTRLVTGLFTGPVYFHTARTAVTTLDASTLTTEQRALVESAVPGGIERVTQEVAAYAESEATLRQSAVGWNVARLRVDLEHPLVPMLYAGVGGQLGYHFILTGADAAAEARRQAIDDLAAQYGISEADTAELTEAVGGRELTVDNLDGLHWTLGAYVKFEI